LLYDFIGGFVKVTHYVEVQSSLHSLSLAEFIYHLVCFVSISAGESNDYRYVYLDLLSCLYDSFSNYVTFHDSSKYVDEDCFDMLMLRKNLKASLHLVSRCTTTNIQKVCRQSTFQLNNIHSSHGKSCSVDHAPNVSIEGNIVESNFCCFFLVGIDIRCRGVLVLESHDIQMTEQGIIIKIDFSINAVYVLIGSDSPRIDFDLGCIQLHKHLIHFL